MTSETESTVELPITPEFAMGSLVINAAVRDRAIITLPDVRQFFKYLGLDSGYIEKWQNIAQKLSIDSGYYLSDEEDFREGLFYNLNYYSTQSNSARLMVRATYNPAQAYKQLHGMHNRYIELYGDEQGHVVDVPQKFTDLFSPVSQTHEAHEITVQEPEPMGLNPTHTHSIVISERKKLERKNLRESNHEEELPPTEMIADYRAPIIQQEAAFARAIDDPDIFKILATESPEVGIARVVALSQNDERFAPLNAHNVTHEPLPLLPQKPERREVAQPIKCIQPDYPVTSDGRLIIDNNMLRGIEADRVLSVFASGDFRVSLMEVYPELLKHLIIPDEERRAIMRLQRNLRATKSTDTRTVDKNSRLKEKYGNDIEVRERAQALEIAARVARNSVYENIFPVKAETEEDGKLVTAWLRKQFSPLGV